MVNVVNKRQKKKQYLKRHGFNPPGRSAMELHRFINYIMSATCCGLKITEKEYEKRMLKLDLKGRMVINEIRLQYDIVENL